MERIIALQERILHPDQKFFWFLKLTLAILIASATDFVPDEYYQSTEVAYNRFYGKGHLTWEWKMGIRSYIIPALISGLYTIGDCFGVNTPEFLRIAPHALQAFISIQALKIYYRFCEAQMGKQVGRLAYMLFVVNWFTTYCFARTISNQTEMSLNIFCLWHLYKEKHIPLMVLLVINFFIRPTSAVFWILFLPEYLKKFKFRQIFVSVVVGGMTALFAAWLDIMMYKRYILTPWEFFKFNFLNSGNEDFGVHPPTWYFYSGIPCLLGPLFILVPCGFFLSGHAKRYTVITFLYIVVFSYIGHKEIRFLLPIAPLLFIVIAAVLMEMYAYFVQKNTFGSVDMLAKSIIVATVILLLIDLTVMVSVGFVHQRGYRTVGYQAHEEMEKLNLHAPEVWIITPCYSIPIRTALHNLNAKFVYYICPPAQFNHLYDASMSSDYILQPNSFAEQNITKDIELKYLGRGCPDWIITTGRVGADVLNTLKQLANTSYITKNRVDHTIFSLEDESVILLQRAL